MAREHRDLSTTDIITFILAGCNAEEIAAYAGTDKATAEVRMAFARRRMAMAGVDEVEDGYLPATLQSATILIRQAEGSRSVWLVEHQGKPALTLRTPAPDRLAVNMGRWPIDALPTAEELRADLSGAVAQLGRERVRAMKRGLLSCARGVKHVATGERR